MIKLIVTEANKTYTRYFADPEIMIGRSEANHLQLNDPKSSRHHCRIDQIPGGYKVVDLESQNGTLLNGETISQKTLKPGDRIEIGEVGIYFQKGPTDKKEDRWRNQREKLAVRLRKIAEEFYRARGEEGLHEGEKAFAEVLDKRGLSSLKNLEDRYRNLIKLQEINKALNSELQLQKLLSLILDNAIEITGAARGFMILFNREGKMEIPVARNFDRELIHKPDFKISKSIAEEVGLSARPILTANAGDDDRFSASLSVAKLNLNSILCVPVQSPDKMLGVIYLDNPFKEGVFTRGHLALLSTFANQSAVALRNSLLVEELKISRKKYIEMSQEKNRLQEQEVPAVVTLPKKPKPRKEFKYNYDPIVGSSPKLLEIFEVLDKIIDSDVSVLIQGESGTGKELIAQAIHFNSGRKDKNFVSENCAAIAGTLLESELFGYMKGAFTGANQRKIGLFEVANGGTLFLDEIGDTSVDMQKKLLRVLQEGEFRPVGGGKNVKVDVRLLSASNRDLRTMIEEKKFREDLFYRINVISIHMPSLRERREDIPLLVEYFLEKYARENNAPIKSVSAQGMTYLLNHDWPGNVRELENEIQRAIALSDDEIDADVLSENLLPGRASADLSDPALEDKTLKEIVKMETEKVESRVIQEALRRTGWKKNQTAKLLGISRPTLDAKIEAYRLKRNET